MPNMASVAAVERSARLLCGDGDRQTSARRAGRALTDPVEEVVNCRRLAGLSGRSYPSPVISAHVGAASMIVAKAVAGTRCGTERRDGSERTSRLGTVVRPILLGIL